MHPTSTTPAPSERRATALRSLALAMAIPALLGIGTAGTARADWPDLPPSTCTITQMVNQAVFPVPLTFLILNAGQSFPITIDHENGLVWLDGSTVPNGLSPNPFFNEQTLFDMADEVIEGTLSRDGIMTFPNATWTMYTGYKNPPPGGCSFADPARYCICTTDPAVCEPLTYSGALTTGSSAWGGIFYNGTPLDFATGAMQLVGVAGNPPLTPVIGTNGGGALRLSCTISDITSHITNPSALPAPALVLRAGKSQIGFTGQPTDPAAPKHKLKLDGAINVRGASAGDPSGSIDFADSDVIIKLTDQEGDRDILAPAFATYECSRSDLFCVVIPRGALVSKAGGTKFQFTDKLAARTQGSPELTYLTGKRVAISFQYDSKTNNWRFSFQGQDLNLDGARDSTEITTFLNIQQTNDLAVPTPSILEATESGLIGRSATATVTANGSGTKLTF